MLDTSRHFVPTEEILTLLDGIDALGGDAAVLEIADMVIV